MTQTQNQKTVPGGSEAGSSKERSHGLTDIEDWQRISNGLVKQSETESFLR